MKRSDRHNDYRIRYNVALIRRDMAERGWLATDLADATGLTDQTISVFLKDEIQTPRTAKRIAQALRRSVRRYMISSASEAVA